MSDLDDWFDRIWFKYPNDLSHKKKGARKTAQAAAEKIFKAGGIEELKRIERNMDALIKHDRKEQSAGGKPDRWPYVSSFLNQGYYDREINAEVEQKQRIEVKCACGEVAVVGDKCPRCYEKAVGDSSSMPLSVLSDRLRLLGLWRNQVESDKDWGRRCRHYAKQHFGQMAKLIPTREPGEDG